MNWRALGDCGETAFLNELAGTPLESDALDIYRAVSGNSILFLAHCHVESNDGRSALAQSNKNIVGLRPRGGGDGFMSFGAYSDCAREWFSRVTDPLYAYAPTQTVEQYVHTYAPSSDGNDEAGYVATIVSFFTRLGSPGVTTMNYNFGNIQHPPFDDNLILDQNNGAWDDLGTRNPKGVVHHSLIGTIAGTTGWFSRGINVSNGLTDYGVGLDGGIIRWNDPLGHAHDGVSPNRAGWASGGSDGLEGDGPRFVATLGVNAINRDMVSIEREDNGDINTPMTPAQFESICQLTAYWADFAKIPYDQFPFNPNAGCVTDMLHKEFATKDCPFPAVYNRINELQTRTRAIMQKAQATTGPAPTPKPNPDRWPNGWTTDQLRARFKTLKHQHVDGSITRDGFSVNGVISNAWVAECARLGFTDIAKLPKPFLRVDSPGPDRGIVVSTVTFDAIGPKNLTLVHPGVGNATWKWVN